MCRRFSWSSIRLSIQPITARRWSWPLFFVGSSLHWAEAVGNSPEQFAAFIRAEAEKYARIAKATGVNANQ